MSRVVESAELFLAVVPVFVDALPSRPKREPRATDQRQPQPEDWSRAERANAIVFLRFEIQQLPKVLPKDYATYDLSDEVSQTASDALDDILFVLDELIDDAIIKQSRNVSSESCQRFSNLQALKHILCSRKQTTISDTLSHFPADILKWIQYPTADAMSMQYRRIANPVKQFREIMRPIFEAHMVSSEPELASPKATQIYYPSSQSQHDPEENTRKALADIEQAQRLCESTVSITKVFKTTLQQCQPPHSAHVHLSGFKKPEIDMVVSVCGGMKSKKWHTVHWSIPSGRNPRQPCTNTLCSELKESRRRMAPLQLQLQHDGSWSKGAPSARIKDCVSAPTESLQEWLTRMEGEASPPESSKLKKKDILHLALMIARSLFYLLGSPLLQDPLETETICVAKTECGSYAQNLWTKAYTAAQLAGYLDKEDPNQSGRATLSILHLGRLLLTLFFRRQITVEAEDGEVNEDNDETESLFFALNREHIHLKESSFVDPSCLIIIRNCLDICWEVDTIDAPFRTKFYWSIVEPLIQSFRSYDFSDEQTAEMVKSSNRSRGLPSNCNLDQKQAPKMDAQLEKNVIVMKQGTMLQSWGKFADAKVLASTGTIRDSESWLNCFDFVNSSLRASLAKGTRALRVAVLDTGCDVEHTFFSGPGDGQAHRLDGHWFDCLGESNEPIDEDLGRHGTAMVALLLRLLPHAEIYVVRVARGMKSDAESGVEGLSILKESTSKAIRHAVNEWDVDIVSMSFGFSEEIASIRNAILDAETAKDGKILFFAAANNAGQNELELFPAFFESVISVRGTDFNGSFDPQYDPPSWPHKDGTCYGTLGKDVACGWTAGSLRKSGCSVATPIMAAIAATVIYFVARNDSIFPQEATDAIKTRRGILSVFNVMTMRSNRLDRRYLAPWQLFGRDAQRKLSSIAYALDGLPPQEPAKEPRQKPQHS